MQITVGTSEFESTFYTQAEAIAAIAKEQGAFDRVEVFPTPTASVGNAERLETGQLEFGFLAANWIGRAARGEAPFERALDIRMAAPANSGPMFFVALRDSGLETVDDLRGRRVSIGPAGSGMAQHVATMFGVLGVGFETFEQVHLNFLDGANALAAGEIDAQFQCPIPNKVMTELAERADIRVLDYRAGQLETLLDRVGFYRPARVRAGALRGHDRDSDQIGVLNVIATHARTPDDTVGRLALLMATQHESLAALNPLFDGLDRLFDPLKKEGAEGLAIDGVPLHPAAAAAYRELGLIGP